MHNIMLENMLKLANPGMLNEVPRCNEILSDLACKTNMAFRELTIYLTVFGSWSNGFIYYPPDGFIKNSDSHAYQVWVEILGQDKSLEMMKRRTEVLELLSKYDLRMMALIRISIIVDYAVHAKMEYRLGFFGGIAFFGRGIILWAGA